MRYNTAAVGAATATAAGRYIKIYFQHNPWLINVQYNIAQPGQACVTNQVKEKTRKLRTENFFSTLKSASVHTTINALFQGGRMRTGFCFLVGAESMML